MEPITYSPEKFRSLKINLANVDYKLADGTLTAFYWISGDMQEKCSCCGKESKIFCVEATTNILEEQKKIRSGPFMKTVYLLCESCAVARKV